MAFAATPLSPLYEMPAITPQASGSVTGDLGLSWAIGKEQLKGVPAWMHGAGASLLERAGFEDAARGHKFAAMNIVDEMYENIGAMEALYTGPHSWQEATEQNTIGSYALWGINEAVKQTPTLALQVMGALASGGVGSVLGRFALGRAVGLVPGAAGRRATIAGVGLTSALLNTGEIYSSALMDSGENNPVVTGLAGILAGSIDMWPGSKVIRAMGRSEDLGSHIANMFLRDKKKLSRIYRVLELGVTEGFVEDIQTVIEAATVNYLNDNDLARVYVDYAYGFVPITAEQVAERMEARAAGGLLGGLLGVPGRTSIRVRPKQTITPEDIQEIDDQLVYSLEQYERYKPTPDLVNPFATTINGRPLDATTQEASEIVPPAVPQTKAQKDIAANLRREQEEIAAVKASLGVVDIGAPTQEAETYQAIEDAAAEITGVRTPAPPRVEADVRAYLGEYADDILATEAEWDSIHQAALNREEYNMVAQEVLNDALKGRMGALEAEETRQVQNSLDDWTSEMLATGYVGLAVDPKTGIPTRNDLKEVLKDAGFTTERLRAIGHVGGLGATAKVLNDTVIQYAGEARIQEARDEAARLAQLNADQIAAEEKAKREQKLSLYFSPIMAKLRRLGQEEDLAWLESVMTYRPALGEEARRGARKRLARERFLEDRDQRFKGVRRVRDLGERKVLGFPVTELEERVISPKTGKPVGLPISVTKIRKGRAGRVVGRRVAAAGPGEVVREVTMRKGEKPTRAGVKGKGRIIQRGEYKVPIRRPTEPVIALDVRKRIEEATKAADEAEKAAIEFINEVGQLQFQQTAEYYNIIINAFDESEAMGNFPRGSVKVMLAQQVRLLKNEMETASAKRKAVIASQLADLEGVSKKLEKDVEVYSQVPGSVWYDLDFFEKSTYFESGVGLKLVSDFKAEIAKRTGRKPEDIKNVSLSGTYVVHERPPHKRVLRYKTEKKTIGKRTFEVFVLDDKGMPIVWIEDAKPHERTTLPERLIAYDANDNILYEQMIDDRRNYQLIGELSALKTIAGKGEYPSVEELHQVAKNLQVKTKFLGILTVGGRAKFFELGALDLPREELKNVDWYAVSTEKKTDEPTEEGVLQRDNHVRLTMVPELYESMLTVGMTVEQAQSATIVELIQVAKEEAQAKQEYFTMLNPNITESQLKKEGAFFDVDMETNLEELVIENWALLMVGEAEIKPLGAKQTNQQIYESLRKSQSFGSRIMGQTYYEDQADFYARSSTPPQRRGGIAEGTKVVLTPKILKPVLGAGSSKSISILDSNVRRTSERMYAARLAWLRGQRNRELLDPVVTRLEAAPQNYEQIVNKLKEVKGKRNAAAKLEKTSREEYAELQLQLERELGNILDREYTIKEVKDGKYIINGWTLSQDEFIVIRYSEAGLVRSRAWEEYHIQQRAREISETQKRTRARGDTPKGLLSAIKDPKDRALQKAERDRSFLKAVGGLKEIDKQVNQMPAIPIKGMIEEVSQDIEKALANAKKAYDTKEDFTLAQYEKEKAQILGSRLERIFKKLLDAELISKSKYNQIVKREKTLARFRLRRGRLYKQFQEDKDFISIGSLQDIDGNWKALDAVKEQVFEVGAALNFSIKGYRFKKGIPRVSASVGYSALKRRHKELQTAIGEREEGATQAVQDIVAQKLDDRKPWSFVQTEDRPKVGARLNKIGGYMTGVSRFDDVSPVARWQNQFGTIIDHIEFTKDDRTYTLYEALDPFYPNNYTRYNSLEEARIAFGQRYYKEKMQYPAGEKVVPSEYEARIKQLRGLKQKGRTSGPTTFYRGVTTQSVLAEIEAEKLERGEEFAGAVPSDVPGFRRPDEKKAPAPEGETMAQRDYRRMYWPSARRLLERLHKVPRSFVDQRGVLWMKVSAKGAPDFRRRWTGWVPDIRTRTDDEILKSLVLEGEYTEGMMPHLILAKDNLGGSTREEVMERVQEAFGRQVLNIVRVVQSQDQLPINLRVEDGVRGITSRNQIWLVADNLPDNRIVPVVLHEMGSHGLQAIMGKKFYQKLMAQVANLAATDPYVADIYKTLKEGKMKGEREALIIEETMAYVVENEAMRNNAFWRSLIDAILYGLARLKMILHPKWIGAGDLLVLAKASAKAHAAAAKNKEAVFVANFLDAPLYSFSDIFNWKVDENDYASGIVTELGETLEPHQTQGFWQDWMLRDMPLPQHWWENFLVIRQVGVKPDEPPVPGIKIRKLGGLRFQMWPGENIVKWITNYFVVIQRMEKSIEQRGGKIDESMMPSLFHGGYKNRVNFLRRQFHKADVHELREFMREHNISGTDLHTYLYGSHAPFRNLVFKAKAKARKTEFASGISDEAAALMIRTLQENLTKEEYTNLTKAANIVYKINQRRQEYLLEEGLIDQETLETWNKNENFKRTYVPLRGITDVVNNDFFEEPLAPGKLGIRGYESKAVAGRTSPAENTWAWSIMQMDHAFDRAEKNKVVKSFARLIFSNEDDLKNDMIVVSREQFKRGVDPATGGLFLTGEDIRGLHPEMQSDPAHNIGFKDNGKEFVIVVRDKRIGEAFNRTNMSDSGVIMQWFSNVNRFFSAIHTSLSPEFVLVNFVRDFQTALINLQSDKQTIAQLKDAEGLSQQVVKDVKNAAIGLKLFIRDNKTDTEWSELAREFSAEGGRIDFFGFRDARDFEKDLNDYITDTTAAGARRWKNRMLEFVGEYNAVFENTMRLSTYKNVRDAFISNGMSEADAKRRAADVARNLTVNFSQKGEKTQALNSLYLFFNASVQGTVRMFQAMLKRPPGQRGMTRVQKIMSSIALFGFAQGIINSLLAGDDEDGINRYRQVDLKTRERQAHIYLPGFDVFIKIPLPYGYNIPYAIGDTLAAIMMGHTTGPKAASHLFSTTVDSFLPFSWGGSDNLLVSSAKTLSPTLFDPLIDLAVNESYFGQPIYKEAPYGSADPPSERYWSSTAVPFKAVSRFINAITGGSQVKAGWASIPPDIFEHIWETVAGSAGRFLAKTTNLAWSIGPMPGRITHPESRDIIWSKVPFARRFFHDATASKNRYAYDKYAYYEQSIRSATSLDAGIRSVYGVGKMYKDFQKSDDYKLFRLNEFRRDIAGRITKLQKDRAQILRNRIMRDDIKEDRINNINRKTQDLRIKLINKVDAVLG